MCWFLMQELSARALSGLHSVSLCIGVCFNCSAEESYQVVSNILLLVQRLLKPN